MSEMVNLKGTFALGINQQPTCNMHIEFLFAKIMVNMEIFHVLKINTPSRNTCRHTVQTRRVRIINNNIYIKKDTL